jgi:Ca-activated chloride channel family protein
MKVKSVGILAAAGMLLSSLTVWSLTTPKPEQIPLTALPEPTASIRVPDRPAAFSGNRFVSGNKLMVDGRLGHASVEAERAGENFLFVDISAQQDAASAAAPLNLTIVIDRSGSMKGARLRNAVDAARNMVSRLRDGDVVSLVTYNTQSDVRVPPTPMDTVGRSRVLGALSGIHATGDTCISCGIKTGIEQLQARNNMVNRMLLLSDGEATAGVRDMEGFRRIAERARLMSIPISSIGVDVDYNERLLAALARESNGRHHFVENTSDLSAIFDEELQSLNRTVADAAELSVELAPNVEIIEVFDRVFRREGRRLVVPFGSFSAGERKTLLVKVSTQQLAELAAIGQCRKAVVIGQILDIFSVGNFRFASAQAALHQLPAHPGEQPRQQHQQQAPARGPPEIGTRLLLHHGQLFFLG